MKRILLLAALQWVSATLVTQAGDSHETRMEWWHEAKFGMFIHWGLYAIPARGEWVMSKEKIPVAEYAKLAIRFNPVKFNADEWVRFAKDAGMKYIVITSKHHDGFAMYGSKVNPYNIVDATPFKRDPLKELAAACEKEGIKLGFYYSQAQDWHQPGGAAARGAWDPAQAGDFDHYLHTLAIPQVKELLGAYHPSVIWFDTPVNMTPANAREMVKTVRELRPETIINSRLLAPGKKIDSLDVDQLAELRNIGVDYLSYADRQIPRHPAPSWGRDWETCMTLNDAWGYTAADHHWKSPQTVIRMLARVAHKGGNFLLNFGPTAEGEIPAESQAVMKQVGAWLLVNGEAIYGTAPSDLTASEKPRNEAPRPQATPADRRAKKKEIPEPDIDWLATARPASKKTGQAAKLYLHIFKWPAGRLEIGKITGRVAKAYFLSDASRSPLNISQNDGAFAVELPADAPDPFASVVCLELAQP